MSGLKSSETIIRLSLCLDTVTIKENKKNSTHFTALSRCFMSSGNCSTFSRFSSATLNVNMLHSVHLLIVDSIIESYILVGNLTEVHNKLTNLRYACFSLFVSVVPILGTGSLSCGSVTVFPRFIALVTAFPR